MITRRRMGHRAVVILLALTVVAACTDDNKNDGSASSSPSTSANPSSPPTTHKQPGISTGAMSIQVLSSQPDRVTGGDARILVTPPRGTSVAAVKVSVDGHDVTGRLDRVGGHLEGIVAGFVEGRSTLAATAGSHSVERRIRDYPISGPMISGPHLPLLVCTTEKFGLGKATDSDCSAPERVFYKYVSTCTVR